MRFRAAITFLIVILFAVACGRSTWPPNQAQLARLFVQQKATFVQIEQEMASDGLLRMGQGVLSETARNPTIPKLPSNQASKYVSLLDRTQMYLNVMRRKESTEFELLIQNIGPRLYLPRYIHTSTNGALPNCAPAMEQMACGTCSIHLERDWLLEYSWFPANPEVEAREC